jgi:hypothetical protein
MLQQNSNRHAESPGARPLDRRANPSSEFPLKRRTEDDLEIASKDPYLKLNARLIELAHTEEYNTIVIASELRYLASRIEKIFPKAIIRITSERDVRLKGKVLCLLNLNCRRRHEPYTNLTFHEVAAKNPAAREPLFTLNFVSRGLRADDEVTFASLGDMQNRSLTEKYLLTQKFTAADFQDNRIVKAKKRPLLQALFKNNKLSITETQRAIEIREVQAFLKQQFSLRDFNYIQDIDDLFTAHSDFFVVKNVDSGAIVAIARHTWHLPNHMLPLMLATKAGTSHHVQLQNPDQRRYGEAMIVYEKNFRGAVAYREIISVLFKFFTEAGMDIIFTTHKEDNKFEGAFYRRRYGFEPTGVVLEYGDFGGRWTLVYGSWDSVHMTWVGTPLQREKKLKELA